MLFILFIFNIIIHYYIIFKYLLYNLFKLGEFLNLNFIIIQFIYQIHLNYKLVFL